MCVCGIGADHIPRDGWDIAEIGILGGGGAHDVIPQLLRFLECLTGELPRHKVIRFSGTADQIEGHGSKLRRRPALQKQHLIVVRNVHQPAQIGLRLLYNGFIVRRAVAHLHDRHSGRAIANQFGRRALQHGKGEHGRTCRKIEYSVHIVTSIDRC